MHLGVSGPEDRNHGVRRRREGSRSDETEAVESGALHEGHGSKANHNRMPVIDCTVIECRAANVTPLLPRPFSAFEGVPVRGIQWTIQSTIL
jgi:hypothetical protein